jgi:hypothetical protein
MPFYRFGAKQVRDDATVRRAALREGLFRDRRELIEYAP